MVRWAVVTNGPHGVFVRYARHGIPRAGVSVCAKRFDRRRRHAGGRVPVRHHAGLPPSQAARAACFLASKVITQIGARLHHGTKEYWEQGMKAE